MPDPMKAETAPNGLPTRADGGRAFPFRSLEKGDPIMKRIFWPALLPLLLLAAADVLPAQQRDEEFCVITVRGQNRNRTVAGAIAAECTDVSFPGQLHDPPWGNWGVSSNYSSRLTDTDQFRGWKWKDGPRTKLQWNSCTTREKFRAPNRKYYNSSDHRSQRSNATVTHGTYGFRATVNCPDPLDQRAEPPAGCSGFNGFTVRQSENYMTLYELDRDGNDLIKTLYFPGTSLSLRNCTRDGCPERTSGWRGTTRFSAENPTANVGAQLRMKASAAVHGSCVWDWY